jgi:PAS domain S-box-containing protein
MVSPDTTVVQAIAQMKDGKSQLPDTPAIECLGKMRSRCAIAVEKGRLVGILTDLDVLDVIVRFPNLEGVTMRSVMLEPRVTLRESAQPEEIVTAIELCQREGINYLPIVDECDRLVGLTTPSNLLCAIGLGKTAVMPTDVSPDSQLERESKDGEPIEIFAGERDGNLNRLAECWCHVESQLTGQNAILAKIARDEPLDRILHDTIELVETTLKDSMCSILLLDREGRLRPGAAPSLPPDYNYQIDGIAIGEGVGSCVTAAFRQSAVIVSDIERDRLWKDYKDLALQYGLRACWSIPIIASDGKVLGTFGIYYPVVRSPQPQELNAIAQMANLAGIAIERQRSQTALKESELRWQFALEGAGDGIWDYSPQDNRVFYSSQWKAMLGYADDEVSNDAEAWSSRIHPDDRDRCFAMIGKYLECPQGDYYNEHRLRCKDGSYKWILARGKAIEFTEDGRISRMVGTHTDITDRKQSERQLQSLIEGTAATTGKDFFAALVTHMAQAVNVSYAIVTEKVGDRLQMLAYWANGSLQPTFAYNPAETPCELTLKLGKYYCESYLQYQFPKDLDLVQMQADSYLGIALKDSKGNAIGHLCILHQQKIVDPQRAEKLLSVFAARAAAELERKHAIESLERLNRELEDKVAERTAELQEREQFLQTVLDSFPMSVFWKDRNSIYLGCNRHFLQDANLNSVEEIVGKTDRDMPWGETEADLYRADDREVMENNRLKLGIIETQIQADGKQIWVETNKTPLHDLNGNVIGVLGTYQDITENKRAEEKIELQLAAIEAAIDGIGILQGDKYLYLNQAHLDLFGYERSELIGKSWRTLYQPEQLAKFDREVLPTLIRDRSWQGEAIGTRKDGSTIIQGLSLTLTADNLLICVTRDISNIKQAELALQASEIRFRRIFESSVVGMLFADFQGRIVDANDRLLEMLGYSRAELEAGAIRWNEITPPEHVPADFAAMEHLMQYGCITPWEKEYYRKDGSRIPVLIGAAVLQEPANTTICVVLDISDRKQAESQLKQTNEELIRATRLKDEFLANMSHELRTPLNAILGLTEGLQDEVFGLINNEQLNALKTMERSGSHLLALINDILDVAKIESGQVELDCAVTAIAPLCHSSLTFIKQQALKKHIQLETKLPPQLPDLFIDERRIRQVLINLLNNAVKFTPEGGRITLEVTPHLPTSNDSGWVRIAVTDTGIGIAPEHIKKLFQPFIQVDSALNRNYEGTGLGLALVKRIVELHGGEVGLTSEVGVGSCFSIELPCATCDRDRDLPTTFTPSPSLPPGISHLDRAAAPTNPLILLAEDNEANISTVASYLEAKGYRLLLAHNGVEAIEIAQSYQPDLILMDIQMPKMDGLEAMQHLRRDPDLVDVPIIALTALTMTGDRERCLEAGATDYLSKPIKLKQLAQSIQSILATTETGWN